MQKVTLATVLLAFVVGPAAIAQTGKSNGSAGPTAAPIGHRQPTADTVPAYDQRAKEEAKQNAILDKKIKSICRGC